MRFVDWGEVVRKGARWSVMAVHGEVWPGCRYGFVILELVEVGYGFWVDG